MKVLVLGGGGMLGHKLCQVLSSGFEVSAAFRDAARYRELDPFRATRVLDGVDAYELASVEQAIEATKPDAVINCIGIVKQLAEAKDPIASLTINSLFPHRLLQLARKAGARLIHISTDCVFSGRKGMYTEADISDAEDLYGRTKFLGEVVDAPALTLRTSIFTSTGLVEWFLSNEGGCVRGFTMAVYSGFTTIALGRIIRSVLADFPGLHGLYHVSSAPINKYDLLELVRDAFGAKIAITPDASVAIDRSLVSDRFRSATGLRPPAWPEMIAEMAADYTPYRRWRMQRVF
jgi:dTDP-4-dehydrorhamnose reductase